MSSLRYRKHALTTDERPRHRFEYWVTGSMEFPFDMLRYDQAWPASSEDAQKISWAAWKPEAPMRRCIKLYSHREPQVARWSSFVWSVSNEEFPV